MKVYIIIIAILFLGLVNCQKDPIIANDIYESNLSFIDNSSLHPKKISFENAMKELKEIAVGVQVSVRSIDGNVWTGSQGYVDINNGVITKKSSSYLIGSVSKIFTSVLIMNLQDEGLLSINDPIKDILDPELINEIENADQVTIKNLLMHTSGIKEYIGIEFQVDRLNTSRLLLTPTQKLGYIYNKSADFEPNEKYGYSNTNYVLLGLIIEKVKHIPLEEAVELYITNVLSLKNTIQGTWKDPLPSGTARPYLDRGNGYVDIMDFALSDAATGDGGILSNTQDLLFFIENIVNNTLVSSASYDEMLNNKVEIKTGKWSGLGIEQEEREYGFRISHTGGTEGYFSILMNYPNSNVTIAVCLNSTSEAKEFTGKLLVLVNKLQEIAFE